MRSPRRLARVATLLGLGACRAVTDPPLPRDAQPLDPPPVYARWWAMAQSCSGASGSLGEVAWYVVPGVQRVWNGSEQVSAYWSPQHNRIVVAGEAQLNGALVRHEMVHALLRGRGHPRAVFLGSCAGVVTCGAECVADAEPAPQPGASVARVAASALEVDVAIAPTPPAVGRDEGFFTVTVTARNPAAHPVVVTAPGGGAPARTFVLGVAGDFGSFQREEAAPDPSVAHFAAGETKRQVYDFRVVPFGTPSGAALGANVLPPGAYTITARYDDRSTGPRPLAINP